MSKIAALASVLVLGLASFTACGPKDRNGNGNGDGGTNGDGGGPTADAHDPNGSACATSKVKAEQTPLDIFIMLDQSGSMADDNKWTNVTAALQSFVSQTGLNNVSVGLQYFALPPGGATNTCTVDVCAVDTDCGAAACGPCDVVTPGFGFCAGALAMAGSADSCTAADYSTASVEIAPLPGVSGPIIASMAGHQPTTGTPTVPALTGAIEHAKSWAMSHAGDAVIVVLATDGDPDDPCTDNDIPHAQAAAMAGATGTPKIATYVIGVGSDLSNLDAIATGGGTGSAFVVDANASANAEFLAAMNAIQHTALGCQYTIPQPADGSPDFSEVNVVYTPGGGGAAQTIPNVPNAAACPATGNAWYYDNAAAPTQILLCTQTCATVTADTSGEVDIALGCSTVIN